MSVKIKSIVVLLFVILCNTALGQGVEHITTLSYEGYIFPSTHIIAGVFPIINSYDLSITQIKKAEDILKKNILDIKKQCCNINRCTVKKYKRQYWGTINEEGHIIVNIYLINNKLLKQINIMEDIINIQDGGCDVICLCIDLETGGIAIEINGVAYIMNPESWIKNFRGSYH